ncbi:MAG TPA: RDD family protein [Terriglobales bacterium]|nr:RDD family protein [Terriglobales bacterium]
MFCPACGSQNAPEAQKCAACGAALPVAAAAAAPAPAAPSAPPGGAPAAPVTAPVATISSDVYVGKYRLAGLGDRFLALVLDGFLQAALFALIGMWAAARWGGVTETGFSLEGPRALVPLGLALAAGFLYFWLMEGLFGATLGKAAMGIQVRRKDASACTLAASLVRNLARLIDGLFFYLLGFFVALFSRLRQRVGDHLAGTVVVQRAWGKALRGAVALLWLAAIGGCLWYAYQIHKTAPLPAGGATGAPASTAGGGAVPAGFTSGDYALVNFSFRESKEGPLRPAGPYHPGDQVYASYELQGASRGPQNQINLAFTITLLDPGGATVETLTTGLNQALDPTSPIKGTFQFPLKPYYPPGAYKVAIHMHDGVSSRDAEFFPGFTVEAPALAPASQLELRDFQFSTAQDGPALTPAVYQPGQTVYYRFSLFGLQFSQDKCNLHIAFKLLGPNGDVLMDKPDWDVTEDSFPYHPATFYIPYHGYISLPSGAAKGSYTQQYVISDNAAGKTLTYEAKFEVK